MLPKARRLKKEDFKLKNRPKSTFNGRFLSVTCYKDSKNKYPKFSVVVGSVVTKNKPARNRLKRRIYHALLPFTENKNTVDVIVFPKKESLKMSYRELEREVSLALHKLKLLKS